MGGVVLSVGGLVILADGWMGGWVIRRKGGPTDKMVTDPLQPDEILQIRVPQDLAANRVEPRVGNLTPNA